MITQSCQSGQLMGDSCPSGSKNRLRGKSCLRYREARNQQIWAEPSVVLGQFVSPLRRKANRKTEYMGLPG